MATLTANLFLDTSGFTSGIDKARSAASNYHQEMSRAAKSISGLEGNIKVLQLQAAGYSDLAASLKQTLAVEAQADKLAKSGLITKEKAIALLNEQRLLETNIATQQKANAAAQAAAAQRTSALTAEVERARAASEQYERQMRKSAEVTSQIQGNIRILEMQAAGYHDLAESMRDSMNIESQAQKLAKDGLMTKKQAIELLTKQHLLEKNVATEKARAAAAEQAASQRAKALAADIERARVAAANYNSEMSRATMALKGVEQNIQILRMQASGHDALAASMKASIELEARAEKLAKEGLITKEKAIALLREQQTLERNIATQKANSASAQAAADKRAAALSNPRAAGLPEAPLTDAYLKQTERAAFVAQDARNKFNRLTGAMGNSSMGFLAFSQAVEDAQYGIKGVLNNIPQMILGFGGSMGLAGAISLAAVAAVQLYPHLKKLFTSVDAEILKAASKEWTNVFQKGMKAAKATYDNAVNSIKLKNEVAEINKYYEKMTALGQDMAAVHRANIERLKTERDLQEQIYEARDRLLKLQGKKDDPTIEREKAEREIASLEKEIEIRRKEQDALNARSQEAQGKKEPLLSMDSNEAILREAEALSKLQEELGRVEAEAATAKKTLEDMAAQGKTTIRAEGRSKNIITPSGISSTIEVPGEVVTNKAIEERKLKGAESRAGEIKKEIENAKKLSEEDKRIRDEKIKNINDEIKKIDDLNQRSLDEEKRLKGLIAQKKELLAIEKEVQAAELKPKQDAYRLEAEMIRARIAGNEKKIADLERQKAIQEEIVALNKLGMTGDKAKDTAAKMVDARAAADEADKNRKDKPKQAGSSGPPVAGQLGSVARATNIMMGRAANDGLLEENRRQSTLLRSIEKNTKPKPTKTEIPDFVFH
jgi:chromosome segregation ATPase